MAELDISKLRVDAAKHSNWNIGFFAAGLLFWIFVGITGNIFSLESARIYWLVGTFFIFPLAVLISKIFNADPFMKGNILGELVGYTHMSVITLSFPIVLVTLLYFPEALILVMAITYCLDFFVMSWAYDTPLFGIHAAFRTIVVTIIFFAVPSWRLSILPAFVAFCYLLTVILIPMLRKKWVVKHQ